MFNITFQQISMFIMIAQRLNITAVAEEMYVSQAALSKMIQRLEDSLDTKLFERNRRGLKLTSEGKFLYNKIVEPFRSICDAIVEMQGMKSDQIPMLKIGYLMTIDDNKDYVKLNNFIKQYKRKNSGVVFSEGVFHFDELKNKLRYGELDIIFLPNFELYNFGDENINSRSVLNYPMYIAVGSQNRARKGDTLDLNILRKQPIYTLQGNGKSESINVLLDKIGYEVIDRRVAPNHDTMIRMLRNNDWGFAVIGNQKFDDKDGIRLFSVTEERYCLSLHMAWRTDNENVQLIRFVREISDNIGKFDVEN